jgi:ribosomal protein S18 acetylase RimI-like enzyme
MAAVTGRPAAFIAWLDDGAGRLIADLYALPEQRRCGIGGRLLHEAIGDAGMPIRLTVAADNPAQHLYRAHGFIHTGLVVPDGHGRHLQEMKRGG